MSKTTLSQPVHDLDGNVTTLRLLLDSGLATVSRCSHFYKRGGGTRVAYFVDLPHDEETGVIASFEVAAHVYDSRSKHTL